MHESQNSKCWKVPLGGHLVQSLCSGRVSCARLYRTMSTQVLSTTIDGDSTTFLGNLLQCLTTLMEIKCFLVFRWSFLFCFFLFVPIASFPVSGYYREEFGSLFFIPFHQEFIYSPPEPSPLRAEWSQLSQFLLIWKMLQSFRKGQGEKDDISRLVIQELDVVCVYLF